MSILTLQVNVTHTWGGRGGGNIRRVKTHISIVCLMFLFKAKLTLDINVRGEPVFSVMAAGWFCEKSG